MLINEQNQRKVCTSNSKVNLASDMDDSTTFMSAREKPTKFKKFSNLYYEYCRFTDHIKEYCYELHGYPPGFKGKRNQQYRQANAVVSDNNHRQENAMSKGKAEVPQEMTNFFTEEQYGQIMRLLNKEKAEDHMANMVGNDASQFFENCRDPWIIDTGATNHMTSNHNLVHNVTNLPEHKRGNVHLPNGKSVPVTYQGSYNLTKNGTVHDVLCVPEFKYNLLSVSKLTRELQCSVNYFSTFCVF
ncbi:hypothetical protein A4A49_53954 [Nicotiana attenuata]|uniref:Retrovirus-related Pol polyprotein from transposon TNT 1-94-like beta-barrel domain-containing protein n=1 Tax=Nicotiana attenuata TaxID=49451 RepID=A0A1J6IBT6_NICAT|nr:hypothetical protein A4A49_62334 [Nicotiana attenuata]OIT36532.1 hypothetical protein A4A49_53954 [Nicotiana attenuata]